MQLSVIFLITVSSGILFSSALLPFQINSNYADESETNTDQGLAQENIGSGESINTNCGENSIGGSAAASCDGTTLPTGEPPLGEDFFVLVVGDCFETQGFVTCRVLEPSDLRMEGFTLTCAPGSDLPAHCFLEIDNDISIDVDCFGPRPETPPALQFWLCSATGPVELNIVVENCEDGGVVLCQITAPDLLSGELLECAGSSCRISELDDLHCEPAPEGDSPVRQELNCRAFV